ncbi:hypothetical protein Jiend_32470 [Micromonospora endophytica]|nr:hypothetical protein Jiend_32470 [Micromonospora endophytica]
MGASPERQEVVLAEAHHVDVPDQHQFLVVGLERGGEHGGRVDAKAGEELGVRSGDPGRGLLETVAVRVLADRDQDLADRFLDPGEVDGVLDRSPGQPAVDQSCGDVVEDVVRFGS